MNITVYLGANQGNHNKFKNAIEELGSFIGTRGDTLIYDGLKELLNTMINYELSSKSRQEGIYFANSLSDIEAILNRRRS